MIGLVSSIRLSERQFGKLADISGDAAQVFLASLVLPGLGFGGSISAMNILGGIVLICMFVGLSVYLLRSPTIS